MSIKSLIKTTLAPTGVPVKLHRYTGTDSTYITYVPFDARGKAFSDDEETVTGHSVQVDVWSTDNLEAVSEQVESLMKSAGFKRNYAAETYELENGTMIYRKIYRFRYAEAVV